MDTNMILTIFNCCDFGGDQMYVSNAMWVSHLYFENQGSRNVSKYHRLGGT